MTTGYAFISIIALVCYVFLLLTFVAAKKNKLIYTFMFVLICMILWTGGSFCMRVMLWPGIKFWYDTSILGLTLAPYAFFLFSQDFIGVRTPFWRKFWLISVCLANIFNIVTSNLLAPPEVMIGDNGAITFIYQITWRVIILYGVTFGTSIHMFYILWQQDKRDELIQQKFMPIVLGILLLYVGNIIIFLPFFQGFPADIFAGIINVFCLFYALYTRRMFKLTLLVSKGSCYVLAAICSLIIFSNIAYPLRRFILDKFPQYSNYDIVMISVIFLLATFCIYQILKQILDKIFIREEMIRSETLKEFSAAVSKSLKIDEILDVMVQVIQTTIGVKKVYVCLANHSGDQYQVTYSTSPLDKRNYEIKSDNPIIFWLKQHNRSLLIKDFRRSIVYKSMWETEKKMLRDLGIACMVPLIDEEHLVGFVMVAGKEKNSVFTYDDLNFLDSIQSISSIAVKNSHLYERVYLEARTDELTGLLNRKYFYEILEQEIALNKNGATSLVFVSVDDFKLYNQLYGMEEGDQALQQIALVLLACVGENGHVARCNGKEFAIILPQYDVLATQNIANHIRQQVMDINKHQKNQLYRQKVLTISAGICAIPYAASNMKQLMEYADLALYEAKRSGKNKVVIYSIGEVKDSRQRQVERGTGYKEGIYSEYASTIYALTAAIDTKDHYTFSHSKNVAAYAANFARIYGLNEESIAIIQEAALLHDIGKIGIPEQILNKPGRLAPEEYKIMQQHVENSIGIIRHLPSLDYVIPAVIGHHERWDGQGYPRRIAGEDIPLSARILCIADSFDAMISRRSYKEPYSVETALRIMTEESGRQFDPHLAPLFVQLVQEKGIRPIFDE